MNTIYSACLYEIQLSGNLPAAWQDYLDGFRLVSRENGTCILRGLILDQSALLGTLDSLLHMDLVLLSVKPVEDQ